MQLFGKADQSRRPQSTDGVNSASLYTLIMLPDCHSTALNSSGWVALHLPQPSLVTDNLRAVDQNLSLSEAQAATAYLIRLFLCTALSHSR